MDLSVPTGQEASHPLSIGELARRTGLTPAALRMWESRYGFPAPLRLDSGHRRYDVGDVEILASVLKRKAAGMRLDAAMAAARDAIPADSIFAALRQRHPQLAPQTLHKSTLVALSRAIEDEVMAGADRPLLFGAFQTSALFERSRARWRDLARTARETVVVAQFEHSEARRRGGLIEVPLAEASPMRREWAVISESVQLPVCLSAWELPGQHKVPGRRRRFECVWSVEPTVVRDASVAAARLGSGHGSRDADVLLSQLVDLPLAPPADPRRTTALFARVVGYVDRVGQR